MNLPSWKRGGKPLEILEFCDLNRSPLHLQRSQIHRTTSFFSKALKSLHCNGFKTFDCFITSQETAYFLAQWCKFWCKTTRHFVLHHKTPEPLAAVRIQGFKQCGGHSFENLCHVMPFFDMRLKYYEILKAPLSAITASTFLSRNAFA